MICDGQLAFDLQEKRDPFTCQHLIRTVYEVKNGEVVCGYKGGETYTNCHASRAGEPPSCVWEPPDNSPEACARRLALFENQERMNDGKATA